MKEKEKKPKQKTEPTKPDKKAKVTGAGKGDSPRKRSVPYEVYANNYDRIFKKKRRKKKNESD